MPDQRLVARSVRMVGATAGMGAALWLALVVLAPSLAHANLAGVVALLGVCALGAVVYAALGALLGVVRLSELRFVLRRQPGLRSARPRRTTVTPARSGRFDEGITSTQLS